MKAYRFTGSMMLMILAMAVAFLFVLLVTPNALQQEIEAVPMQFQSFTGNVYSGTPPETGHPLVGVQVALYGSNNAEIWGSLLDSKTTSLSGHYQLTVSNSTYDYFHIVEIDPAGFISTGAKAGTGGTVVNANWIRYHKPAAGSHSNNDFWDRRLTTETPSTPTSTPTHYPTYTPTHISTGSPTPTPTQAPSGETDLRLTKVRIKPENEPVAPGSVVEYNLTIWNKGTATALGVAIIDTLPEGLIFHSAAPGCTLIQQGPPNDVVRCSFGSVPPGSTGISVWLKATALEQACGRLVNESETISDTPDPIIWNNFGYQQTLFAPCHEPAVLVFKRLVDPPYNQISPDDIVTFTIDIQNIGDAELNEIQLVDTFLSRAFSFVDASHQSFYVVSGSPESKITWDDLSKPIPLGFGQPLTPGQTFTVRVRMKAKTVGSGSNCAVVTAQAGDVSVSDESCAYVPVTQPEQQLVLNKLLESPALGPAVVGQNIVFMIELRNNSDQPIVGVRLRDEYDDDKLSFSHTAYQPENSADDGALDWNDLTRASPLGWGTPLSPSDGRGFSISFQAKAATLDGDPTQNCVRAWYWHADGVEHETSLICTPIAIVSNTEPDLSITKSLAQPSSGIAQPGDRIEFSFRVTNSGAVPLTKLSLLDQYDTECLRFLPGNSSALDPDDLTDDGSLAWERWLGLTELKPGWSVEVATGTQFLAKAGDDCDPTINMLSASAIDAHNNQTLAEAQAPISIQILTATPTATETRTPSVTPSPTSESTATPTATATSEACCYPLYVPLIIRSQA
ncbi:MAG: DUF11 domain-containing protein [Caldilineales bacterium]|nr:DUF11 domain-containing protein [Caldilineales bacterium]